MLPFPLQYAVGAECTERECCSHDLGVRKPIVKEKLKAGIENSCGRGNNESSKRMKCQLKHKPAPEHEKRCKKKTHERKVKGIHDAINAKASMSRSNSDIE